MPITRQHQFKLLSVLFGFGILIASEMLLRVSGRFNIEIKPPEMPENWKSTGIPAAGQPNATLLITKGNQVVLSPMAQSHMKTPAFNVQPATKRIFAFGGSATLGVPVENTPPMTVPGQLSDMLSKVGLQNETLNLGGASFGSDHVKHFPRGQIPPSLSNTDLQRQQ